MVILRTLTGGSVAASVWLMPDDSIEVVKNQQADYETFAITNGGRGEIRGKPNPNAKFLIAVGGIPAINTVDGWPTAGDCWEWFDAENNRTVLICASDWKPHVRYIQYSASPPVNGRSTISGINVEVIETRTGLITYDLQNLPTILSGNPRVVKTDIRGAVDNHHSVTFDAFSSGSIDPGSSITYSHVLATGSDLYLGVLSCSRAGQSMNSVTHNGDTVTERDDTQNVQVRQFYHDRVAPDTGTLNIVVTYNASTSGISGALSASGVDQTTPRQTLATAGGNSATPNTAFTSATDNLLFSATTWNDASTTTITTDTDWTEGWNVVNSGGGGNDRGQAGARIAGATSVDKDDTLSPSSRWLMTGVSIAAAAAGLSIPVAMHEYRQRHQSVV